MISCSLNSRIEAGRPGIVEEVVVEVGGEGGR